MPDSRSLGSQSFTRMGIAEWDDTELSFVASSGCLKERIPSRQVRSSGQPSSRENGWCASRAISLS